MNDPKPSKRSKKPESLLALPVRDGPLQGVTDVVKLNFQIIHGIRLIRPGEKRLQLLGLPDEVIQLSKSPLIRIGFFSQFLTCKLADGFKTSVAKG